MKRKKFFNCKRFEVQKSSSWLSSLFSSWLSVEHSSWHSSWISIKHSSWIFIKHSLWLSSWFSSWLSSWHSSWILNLDKIRFHYLLRHLLFRSRSFRIVFIISVKFSSSCSKHFATKVKTSTCRLVFALIALWTASFLLLSAVKALCSKSMHSDISTKYQMNRHHLSLSLQSYLMLFIASSRCCDYWSRISKMTKNYTEEELSSSHSFDQLIMLTCIHTNSFMNSINVSSSISSKSSTFKKHALRHINKVSNESTLLWSRH